MKEILQFMTVRRVIDDEEIPLNCHQEPEWNDAYYDCPEYRDYETEWN